MKTFKELTIGDIFYVYFTDGILPFRITKIEKYSGLTFNGMLGRNAFVSTWIIPRNCINSSLTPDCAVTFDLAKQHQSKLVYKNNLVRRYQYRYQRTTLITEA